MPINVKKIPLKLQSGIPVNQQLLGSIKDEIRKIEFINLTLINYVNHTPEVLLEKKLLMLKWIDFKNIFISMSFFLKEHLNQSEQVSGDKPSKERDEKISNWISVMNDLMKMMLIAVEGLCNHGRDSNDHIIFLNLDALIKIKRIVFQITKSDDYKKSISLLSQLVHELVAFVKRCSTDAMTKKCLYFKTMLGRQLKADTFSENIKANQLVSSMSYQIMLRPSLVELNEMISEEASITKLHAMIVDFSIVVDLIFTFQSHSSLYLSWLAQRNLLVLFNQLLLCIKSECDASFSLWDVKLESGVSHPKLSWFQECLTWIRLFSESRALTKKKIIQDRMYDAHVFIAEQSVKMHQKLLSVEELVTANPYSAILDETLDFLSRVIADFDSLASKELAAPRLFPELFNLLKYINVIRLYIDRDMDNTDPQSVLSLDGFIRFFIALLASKEVSFKSLSDANKDRAIEPVFNYIINSFIKPFIIKIESLPVIGSCSSKKYFEWKGNLKEMSGFLLLAEGRLGEFLSRCLLSFECSDELIDFLGQQPVADLACAADRISPIFGSSFNSFIEKQSLDPYQCVRNIFIFRQVMVQRITEAERLGEYIDDSDDFMCDVEGVVHIFKGLELIMQEKIPSLVSNGKSSQSVLRHVDTFLDKLEREGSLPKEEIASCFRTILEYSKVVIESLGSSKNQSDRNRKKRERKRAKRKIKNEAAKLLVDKEIEELSMMKDEDSQMRDYLSIESELHLMKDEDALSLLSEKNMNQWQVVESEERSAMQIEEVYKIKYDQEYEKENKRRSIEKMWMLQEDLLSSQYAKVLFERKNEERETDWMVFEDSFSWKYERTFRLSLVIHRMRSHQKEEVEKFSIGSTLQPDDNSLRELNERQMMQVEENYIRDVNHHKAELIKSLSLLNQFFDSPELIFNGLDCYQCIEVVKQYCGFGHRVIYCHDLHNIRNVEIIRKLFLLPMQLITILDKKFPGDISYSLKGIFKHIMALNKSLCRQLFETPNESLLASYIELKSLSFSQVKLKVMDYITHMLLHYILCDLPITAEVALSNDGYHKKISKTLITMDYLVPLLTSDMVSTAFDSTFDTLNAVALFTCNLSKVLSLPCLSNPHQLQVFGQVLDQLVLLDRLCRWLILISKIHTLTLAEGAHSAAGDVISLAHNRTEKQFSILYILLGNMSLVLDWLSKQFPSEFTPSRNFQSLIEHVQSTLEQLFMVFAVRDSIRQGLVQDIRSNVALCQAVNIRFFHQASPVAVSLETSPLNVSTGLS